jgi:hypothetical protein
VRTLSSALRLWARDGFRLVASPVYRERRRICRECSGGSWTCPNCGCVKIAKAWARAWQCPLGKWPGDKVTR